MGAKSATGPVSPRTKAKRAARKDERFKEILDAAANDLWAARGSRPSNMRVPLSQAEDPDDYLADESDDD